MRTWITALGVAVMTAGLLGVPAGDAWAAGKKAQASADKPAKSHTHRAKRAKGGGGGGETTVERDRRLSRECKGLPNAGACLGYAN